MKTLNNMKAWMKKETSEKVWDVAEVTGGIIAGGIIAAGVVAIAPKAAVAAVGTFIGLTAVAAKSAMVVPVAIASLTSVSWSGVALTTGALGAGVLVYKVTGNEIQMARQIIALRKMGIGCVITP